MATGVYAAATFIKAKPKRWDWLADRVGSGVPAGEVGDRRQEIEIGFMSGASNVICRPSSGASRRATV